MQHDAGDGVEVMVSALNSVIPPKVGAHAPDTSRGVGFGLVPMLFRYDGLDI